MLLLSYALIIKFLIYRNSTRLRKTNNLFWLWRFVARSYTKINYWFCVV